VTRQAVKDWALALLAGLAVAGFALALASMGGCAALRKPPAAPPEAYAVAVCAAPQPAPQASDVCPGSTPEGLRCVHCEVPRGCLLEEAVVYCTPSCRDPYCTSAREGGGARHVREVR
jgi:hypothetical protein